VVGVVVAPPAELAEQDLLFFIGQRATNMKWARKVNSYAVDVRVENPEGFFTEQVVAEFIVVPDEVQDHWFYDEEAETWLSEQPQPEPIIQVTRI